MTTCFVSCFVCKIDFLPCPLLNLGGAGCFTVCSGIDSSSTFIESFSSVGYPTISFGSFWEGVLDSSSSFSLIVCIFLICEFESGATIFSNERPLFNRASFLAREDGDGLAGEQGEVRVSNTPSMLRARPKSQIWMVQSSLTKMFPGFKSRWQILPECK